LIWYDLLNADAMSGDERRKIHKMTQEELDQNWEKAKAQLALLTPEDAAKFVDQGGVMFGLIERLVAEGVDLRTWHSTRVEPHRQI
jgi:hypothetical protein